MERTAPRPSAFDRVAGTAARRVGGHRVDLLVGPRLGSRGRLGSGARERWRSLLARFPQSYYAVPAVDPTRGSGLVARRRGGTDGAIPDVAETIRRAALLDSLGLDVEARFEFDRLSRETMSADAHARHRDRAPRRG